MGIVALMGSPRKNGNTDMLLDEMIRGAEDNGHDVIKHYISDLDVNPCKGCGVCTTEGIVSLKMMDLKLLIRLPMLKV